MTNYFAKAGIAELLIEAAQPQEGDHLLVIGPTTGIVEEVVSSVKTHEELGNVVTIPILDKVRRNDSCYILVER